MVKSKFYFREKMVRYTKPLRCAIGAFLLLRSKGYVLILSGYQHHAWLYSLNFFTIGVQLLFKGGGYKLVRNIP